MKWALRYFKFKHITEIMPVHVMCDDEFEVQRFGSTCQIV